MNYKKEYDGKASAIITNADGKTTFQFFASEANKFERRTPSEGGVEL